MLTVISAQAETVYVDDFGAVGDGATFDHKAIMSAMKSAGEGGTVIFSPGKTYNSCRTLGPLDSQHLVGNGAVLRRCDALVTTLLEDAPVGATSIMVEDASLYERGMYITPVKGNGNFFSDGEHEIRHWVFTAEGNEVTFKNGLRQSYSAGDSVTTEFYQISANGNQAIDGFVMDGNRANNDVYVTWAMNRAIHGKDGVTITNSIFKNLPGDGIAAYGGDMLIEGNVFHDTNTAAIHFSGNFLYSDDVIIRNNLMYQTNQQAQRAGHAEGVLTISLFNNEIRVLDNVVANSDAAFISLFHTNMQDWTIKGNKIFHTKSLFTGDGHAGDGHSPHGSSTFPLREIAWSNNYAEDVGVSFMRRFAGGRSLDFEFRDNTVVNGSLLLNGLTDASVDGNNLSDCGTDPLVVTNDQNVSVTNNNLDASFCGMSSAVADLIYNPANGEVTLRPEAAVGISRFMLANNGEVEPFRYVNTILPYPDDSMNTSLGGFILGQYDTVDSPLTGSHALGAILPAGLQSSSEVEEYLVLARFADANGAYGQLKVSIAVAGDLNYDGVADGVDIDLLRGGISAGTTNPLFNVDSAGGDQPNEADFEYLITAILGTSYGDSDLNKNVNFADYVSLTNSFGSSGTNWEQGNFNLDEISNFEDFVLLSNNYGRDFSSGASVQETVPEPASLLLLSLAIGFVVRTLPSRS